MANSLWGLWRLVCAMQMGRSEQLSVLSIGSTAKFAGRDPCNLHRTGEALGALPAGCLCNCRSRARREQSPWPTRGKTARSRLLQSPKAAFLSTRVHHRSPSRPARRPSCPGVRRPLPRPPPRPRPRSLRPLRRPHRLQQLPSHLPDRPMAPQQRLTSLQVGGGSGGGQRCLLLAINAACLIPCMRSSSICASSLHTC